MRVRSLGFRTVRVLTWISRSLCYFSGYDYTSHIGNFPSLTGSGFRVSGSLKDQDLVLGVHGLGLQASDLGFAE